MLMPREKTPDLTLPILGGGTFDLASETSERGVVICFYRGLHCLICAKYLKRAGTPDAGVRRTRGHDDHRQF